MIVISLISYFIHYHNLLGINTKGLYVKVNINEQTMTISHYIVVCHGNADYFKWENVYMIYL